MQLQRNFAQAAAYGAFEVLGFGYDVVDRTPKLIETVTNEDVTAAAARVFPARSRRHRRTAPRSVNALRLVSRPGSTLTVVCYAASDAR